MIRRCPSPESKAPAKSSTQNSNRKRSWNAVCSSGRRQRLGRITKQGNPLLRFLWNEAGAHAARRDPELKRFYRRKLVQKGLGKARVAVARKLGIRLWIMLRDQIDYQEFCRFRD